MEPNPVFTDDQHLRVGRQEFFFAFPLRGGEPGELRIMKSRPLLERYLALLAELRPSRIVELGVHAGGSTALINEVARPERLIAIEIDPEPPPGLVRSLEEEQDRAVRLCCGVDQSDRPRLDAIVAEHLDGSLDLVIDDASHRYLPTLASFEALFPLLRPGGLYVIEDWQAGHIWADDFDAGIERATPERREEILRAVAQAVERGENQQPPSKLAIALLLARASSGDVVESLSIDEHWVVVRRGPSEFTPSTFRVRDLFVDHFGLFPD
jgi:predicted O-methyltransferase YrrM